MMSMVLPCNKQHKINAPSRVILPDELILEILSMLNVKSLMQLKCVSKSWNSIISDSFFVKLHLDKSSRIPHIILFSSHNIKNCIFPIFPIPRLIESPSIDLFTKAYQHESVKKGHPNIIGSCNGLICLFSSLDNDFFLWNPATRKHSRILGCISHCFQHPNSFFKFSFGYDHSTHKYKLLAFRYPFKEVRLFTFGGNDWKNIQFLSAYPYHGFYNYGVYLNNSLTWFALLSDNDIYDHDFNVKQFVIVSLDLGTETCTQFPFPKGFYEELSDMPTVCKLMDSLCFSYCSKELDFVIWQMTKFGVETSWTKLLKFNYLGVGLVGCSIVGVSLLPLHEFQNGDIVILETNDGQLIRYNRRNHRVVGKTTITQNTSSGLWAIPHVESLVSICQK
ncbi:hypothetical protein RYX36_022797 [Vicia faba]